MASVYTSKIDVWLAATLVGAVAAVAWGSADLWLGSGEWAGLLALPLLLLGAGLPLWVLLGTRYLLDADNLRVVCGPFRWRVPLIWITSVEPTRCALSSPALSLDRLRIDYKPGRSIMISPRDMAGFVRELDALRLAATRPPSGP